jgi:predicted alpha/beta superfamily hydrolase
MKKAQECNYRAVCMHFRGCAGLPNKYERAYHAGDTEDLNYFIHHIKNKWNITENIFIAGFSLGGLSALDIVWNHAGEFQKVGVFSGSLWWRRKGYDDGYDDEKDRLMHLQVRHGIMHPWLQFFLQTGVLDEKADRNNNGIIDSIDDALDLIVELKAKGYTDEHIHYLQMDDGKHDVPTWARAFPEFLKWGWAKKQTYKK